MQISRVHVRDTCSDVQYVLRRQIGNQIRNELNYVACYIEWCINSKIRVRNIKCACIHLYIWCVWLYILYNIDRVY